MFSDRKQKPVLHTGSGLTEVPITIKTTDHMPTAPSSDQNVQHPPKNNRQKRAKRNTEQNDNADQLKIAQLLIGNIERKVLDLENSNKLLKQQLQLKNQPVDTYSLPTSHPCVQTSNRDSHCAHSSIGVSELTLVKDRLNSLELDMVKWRLQSIESNRPTSASAPVRPEPIPQQHSQPIEISYPTPTPTSISAEPSAHRHSQTWPNQQQPISPNYQIYYPPTLTPYPVQVGHPQFVPGQYPWVPYPTQPQYLQVPNPVMGQFQGHPLILPPTMLNGYPVGGPLLHGWHISGSGQKPTGNTTESRQYKQERQAYRGRQCEPDRQKRRSQHFSQAVDKDQTRVPHHHLQKDESPLCSDPTNSKCMEERNATSETSSCDIEEVICLDGTPKKIPDMATHSIQGPATNLSNYDRNINMDTSRNRS